SGLLDATILILYTDHGQKYAINERVPLIFHFSMGEHQGRIKTNAQNLDISPTILDYLDLPQPEWMSGESLLKGNPDANRLIFSTGTRQAVTELEGGIFILDESRLKPPFYQFSFLNVIDCQKWYQLNLGDNYGFSWGDVEGHTSPCSEDSLLNPDQIKDAMIEHLSSAGFDVSSIP
ncbi:MAG: hypothetical protein U9R60_13215, partial [Bacteroidota bacterium]|nr:hypothetical protein [Bacteroidota bacterium]